MSTYNYKPGLGNVGSFQVSGVPYVTGGVDCSGALAPQRITFPRVTNWIMVQNADSNDEGDPMKVAFSQNGLDENFFYVDDGTVGPLELKVTELWVSGSDHCVVVAGLTGIEPQTINNSSCSPSGSNWSGSLGALVG